MGMYLNPGNEEFRMILKDDYQDKTGLAAVINGRIDKGKCLICISRPRRFGKSYAAKMLCAYYDHTCDSHELFDGRDISTDASYETHLNQYQVIYLDMTNLLGKVEPEKLVRFIEDSIESEIAEYYPDLKKGKTFDQTLLNAVEITRTPDKNNPKNSTVRKFIMIIDEWDAPIRETPQITEEYIKFLRMLFKSSGTTGKIFAGAYMTGILPIKKYGNESAVSDFSEFSIISPGDYAPYTGFTEDDVKELCQLHDISFKQMKFWYDGYNVGNIASIYNPYAVKKAIENKRFDSYWRHTSAADNLLTYIDMSFKDNDDGGLQMAIARLIDGESIEIHTDSFQNDVSSFSTKDDVLTLLVHLGYLSYKANVIVDDLEHDITHKEEMVRIPNEEVRREFRNLLPKARHDKIQRLLQQSKKLYDDTLAGHEADVVEYLKEIRHLNYAPTFYNNEQALRYVIKFAYIICMDTYLKIEELPSGHGVADVVYLPLKRTDPALLIELKWNKTEEAAIAQIKKKDYPAILSNYFGKIILVGINYDSETDEHTCTIETLDKKE